LPLLDFLIDWALSCVICPLQRVYWRCR
jgi:hypothetical protein